MVAEPSLGKIGADFDGPAVKFSTAPVIFP
jgi:hypothetical protein